MGCAVSQVPDPNVMYGKSLMDRRGPETANTSRTQHINSPITQANGAKANGITANGAKANSTMVNGTMTNSPAINDTSVNDKVVNGTNSNDFSNGIMHGPLKDDRSEKSRKDEINRTLKGDMAQRSDARASREIKLKELQLKREKTALRMSEQMMEETERLSLSTLSRSRTTSRTGSPKLHRGYDSVRPGPSSQIHSTTPSPAYPELAKTGSSTSLGDENSDRSYLSTKSDSITGAIPSALKSAGGRRRKGEPKVRIITHSSGESDGSGNRLSPYNRNPPPKLNDAV